jgi:outer membrane immunogenic protein
LDKCRYAIFNPAEIWDNGGIIMRRTSVLFAAACIVGSTQISYGADLPVKAPAYAPVAMYNWTGFYVGGQVGGAWASSTQTAVDPTGAFLAGTVLNPTTPSGVLGGIYGGYNYQINQMLVGIDADYSWVGLSGGSATDLSNTGIAGGRTTTGSANVKWLATVTGRVGYVINNNWLLFGKGGWAWSSWTGSSTTINSTTLALASTGSSSTNRNGWTLGTGVEWGFAAHWSAKLEYDYVHFNTVSYNATDTSALGVVTTPAKSATSYMNIVKAGVAYRF